MKFSEIFEKQYTGKLIFDTDKYVYTITPSVYTSTKEEREERKKALYQYLITFKDGSEIRVIMNHAQYNGLRRSSIWNIIKYTSGEGGRKLRVEPIKGIEIYAKNIREYEPFKIALEIYGIRVVDNVCERVQVNEPNGVDFYSVYGISAQDKLTYCLADCETLQIAKDFADALNVISGFNLQIDVVKLIEGDNDNDNY